jgi:hypothetical protein
VDSAARGGPAAKRFVSGDSRVHAANVGRRRPHQVDRDCHLAVTRDGAVDGAALPRTTLGVYRAADGEAGTA